MAELLIRAWQPENDIQDIGDIVIIRPDGWQWGNAECLPEYLVVRLPGVSAETIKQLEQAYNDGELLIKRRRFAAPENWVKQKAKAGETFITIIVNEQFIASIEDKIG